MFQKLSAVIKAFLPLVTDTNSAGKRKVSIGRLPLFLVLLLMVFHYATTGAGPDTGVLGFIGMAMAYNGFSKSSLSQGDGGNNEAAEEDQG